MLKKHVQKAVDIYNSLIKKEYRISPISKEDANIFKEIRESLKKLKINDLVAILDNYKYYADKDIEESILEWNTNFNKNKGEDEENEKSINKNISEKETEYIKIENSYFILKFLYNFGKFDRWDKKEQQQSYCIIINKVDEDITKNIPLYSNETFIYYNEEERDEQFSMIENVLRNKNNIKIIDTNIN
jgi:hypothetical protein